MHVLLKATLIAIVLLGALLRAYTLEDRGFDNDEAFAWRVAIKSLPELLITAAGDTTPPAHYLLLKGWMAVWGASPEALRALSALCGVFLIVATYALVVETARWGNAFIHVGRHAEHWQSSPRRVPSNQWHTNAGHWQSQWHTSASIGGLCAALLAAMHSFQLEPSRTARMYSLGALLAVVTAWLLLRALGAQRRPMKWWFAYALAAVLFLYTHHFAAFTLAAQGVFALWCAFSPRAKLVVDQRATRRGALLAAAVALVLYSPWLPAALAQTSSQLKKSI
jgi:uncharacterized membrane protein